MVTMTTIEITAFVDGTGMPVCPFCMELIRNKINRTCLATKNFFKIDNVNYLVHEDCKKGINNKTFKGFKNKITDIVKHPTYHKIILKSEYYGTSKIRVK